MSLISVLAIIFFSAIVFSFPFLNVSKAAYLSFMLAGLGLAILVAIVMVR